MTMYSQMSIYNFKRAKRTQTELTDVRNIGRMVWPDCCVVYFIFSSKITQAYNMYVPNVVVCIFQE